MRLSAGDIDTFDRHFFEHPLVRFHGLDGGRAALTARETEVVCWLYHGKTDAEMAVVLGLSPRTVQKNLEHIDVKRGVETRTAAVTRALALHPPHWAALRRARALAYHCRCP